MSLAPAVRAVLLAGLLSVGFAGSAQATTSGTITVTAGGMRSATDTDSAYANGLPGVAFQKAAWVSNPATATWSTLCTTGASGSCTSASVANGRYLVREAPSGGPAGWDEFLQLAWGGSSSGSSPTRDYVGDITVDGDNPTVHPSTDWSPTAASSSSGRFMTRKDNPPFPSQCGLDVLMLLDRSGSITDQAASYKSAAQQFITTLSGTTTRVKIASFAQSSRWDQSTFLDLEDAASATTANSKIGDVYDDTGGATNWDAGMKLAAGAGVDVVVFITDGNPTWRDSSASASSGTVDLLDLTFGVASANKVKTEGKSAATPAGATVLAVGVGTGVTAANLAAVSGPVAGSDYITSGVAELAAKLQGVANTLCGARIHVRKLTDVGAPATPKAGWTMTAGKPGGSPVTFTPPSISTTGDAATDVIKVDKIPAGGATNLTVAETMQAGYSFAASQCQKNSFPAAASGGAATATIATVNRNDDWFCTFRNIRTPGSVTVVKDVRPNGTESSDGGTFDLDIGGGPLEVDDGVDGSNATIAISPAQGVSITETAGTGTSLARYDRSISCRNGNGTPVVTQGGSTTIDVASGDSWVCTIINTRKTGSVTVVKHLVPAADSGRFDLRVGGTVVADAAGNEDQGTRQVQPGTYTVDETGDGAALTDYASSIACTTNGGPPVAGTGSSMAVAVASNDIVVCEITNTRLGTVVIAKNTAPAGSVPADGAFDFSTSENLGVADFDLLHGQSKTIARVLPNAGAQDAPYVVSEGDEAGYRLSSVDCDDGDSAEELSARRAAIHVSAGETVTCTFTNLALSVDVAVDKTGTDLAHHGDTVSFTFAVTNGGNAPLHDVTVTDKVGDTTVCSPALASKPTNTGAADELDPGDVWIYGCSYALAAGHPAVGEEDARVVDTAVVSAKDEQNRPVASGPDSHTTRILHPGVELTKLVRRQGTTEFAPSAVVHQGDVLEYVVDAVNTGDAALTLDPVTDDHCTLSGPSKVTGDGDGTFEPAERWRWACDIPVTASVDDFVNTATVSGHDAVPGPAGAVSDTDTASAEVLRPKLAIVKTQRIQGAGAPFSHDAVSGHVGDTVEYRIAVTNTGDTALVNVALDDDFCDAAPDGPADDAASLGVGETRVYTCEHTLDAEDADAFENVATATGEDRTGHPAPPVTDAVPGTILRPATLVVKEGNVFAYPGDSVLYTFAVRTSGNTPLSDVSVSDDRCAPVSAAPVAKSNDDGDALLETGEVWTFSCASTIPVSHGIGDVNPLHNIATAIGKDPLGLVVTATDDHDTTVLHPAIAIDKQGAAQATAGTRLDYALVVTNPGDVSFPAQQVVVTDPRCDAPALFVAARRGEGADESPDRFDPGDTRVYTCSVQTTGDMAEVLNTATVVGTDVNGHKVSASDEQVTQLNRAAVAGAQLASPGTSRLVGPSSCVAGPFTMQVRGQNVATVAVFIDGKRYRRIANTANRTSFAVAISPKGRSRGVHKVRVLVSYTESSQTRAKTMRLNFQRCAAKVVRPRYTG